MNATPISRSIYRPGDRAAVTGIYRAVHLRHRMPHEVTVLETETFPPCKRCGDSVRFELLHAAPRFGGDVDLLIALCAFGSALFCFLGYH